jgi:hypothetical protein
MGAFDMRGRIDNLESQLTVAMGMIAALHQKIMELEGLEPAPEEPEKRTSRTGNPIKTYIVPNEPKPRQEKDGDLIEVDFTKRTRKN